jgi:hypothetical protein
MIDKDFWNIFGVMVVPLIGIVIGGMIYWLRKLDDRQYHIAVNTVTRADLVESLRPINERLIRIESRLPNNLTNSTRWRGS